MSFRARLFTFFILIVVVPMAAVGFLVFSLIDQSQTGKTDARAAGIASTPVSQLRRRVATLASHGRFQDVLSAEMEQVRRWSIPGRPDHARHRQLRVSQRRLRPSPGRPRPALRRRRAA